MPRDGSNPRFRVTLHSVNYSHEKGKEDLELHVYYLEKSNNITAQHLDGAFYP